MGGVPGVMRGRVTVLGAGSVGINAVRVAHALGAEVDVLDVNLPRLTYLYDIFGGELNSLFSNTANIGRLVVESDLVIGAVYTRGRRAPTLVTEKMVAAMEPGSVVVDVAVDQGGCVETVHATTHSDPTYVLHDVIHYGVANMPGAVPRTSTFALTNSTLPFVEHMAAVGVAEAVRGLLVLRGGCRSGGRDRDVQRAEAAFVLLDDARQEHGEAFRRVRAQDDPLRELDDHLFLLPRPRLVQAEEEHHLLARAGRVADVCIGAAHVLRLPVHLRCPRGAGCLAHLHPLLLSHVSFLPCSSAHRDAGAVDLRSPVPDAGLHTL